MSQPGEEEGLKSVWGQNSAGHFIELRKTKIKFGDGDLPEKSPPIQKRQPPPIQKRKPPPVQKRHPPPIQKRTPPPQKRDPPPPIPTKKHTPSVSRLDHLLPPSMAQKEEPVPRGEFQETNVKCNGESKTIGVYASSLIRDLKAKILRIFNQKDPASNYEMYVSYRKLKRNHKVKLVPEDAPLSSFRILKQEDVLIVKKIPSYIQVLDEIEIPQLSFVPGRDNRQLHSNRLSCDLGIASGLEEGEVVVYEPDVTIGLLVEDLSGAVQPVFGHLRITNYKLSFTPQQIPQGIPAVYTCELNLPIHSLHRVVKRGVKYKHNVEKFYCIQVRTKYFVDLVLAIPSKKKGERIVFNKMIDAAFVQTTQLAAFKLGPTDRPKSKPFSSADLIDQEFQRQQVFKKVRLSSQNLTKKYSLCETYPLKIAVPAAVSDENLQTIAKFRSRGRIPALTFYRLHNGACLYRCAQPRVGISGRSCEEDEQFVEEVIKSSYTEKVLVADCRPKLNARFNQVMGKGFESEKKYQNMIEIKFLEIENIHAMRDSLKKLKACCLDKHNHPTSDRVWQKALESSKWGKHLRKLIEGVQLLSWHLNEGRSVICHCSDGWDRTSQVCGLAQIVLDPHFRTVQGFCDLVKKDWLAFGHKFHQRSGHGSGKYKESERSPIFCQFIDACWQIMHQFPDYFEFTEHFLMLFMIHVYSCRYGTFLYDCDKQRTETQVYAKTESFWDFVDDVIVSQKQVYLNPTYTPSHSVLLPNSKFVRLWKSYYLFWRLP
eukprot:TRINITY_DN1537_c0_g2_i1.p1 TRINITY_DN1537_c0_g2~~TRINITY_DN1537_c0_g2_i1.p1  ORF type:complete len:767 (-),score=91.19 TRINITY_DN1537_c0_g2_i1:36-2336(-)